MYDRVDCFTVCQPTPFIDHSPVKRWFNISPPTNNSFPEMTGIELNNLPKQFQWNSLSRGGVLPYITYTGMCRPTGSWFWSSWFRTGYPFQRRFLERGIIFRMHESSSFVSSHLKLFKDKLLVKTLFNASTSKRLYPCCTLCFSMQGGRILARAYF